MDTPHEVENESVETCDHCGAPMRKWTHSLTRGLVDSLVVFAQAIKNKGINQAHYIRDTGFNHTQACNFQKLKHFGLVAKYDRDENPKNGIWVLTTLGLEFLQNKQAVPKKVSTYRNIVTEKSDQRVFFQEFIKQGSADYWQTEFNIAINDYKVTSNVLPPIKKPTAFEQPIVTKVKSEHYPYSTYEVTDFGTSIECTCLGFRNRHTCKHVKKRAEEINRANQTPLL